MYMYTFPLRSKNPFCVADCDMAATLRLRAMCGASGRAGRMLRNERAAPPLAALNAVFALIVCLYI